MTERVIWRGRDWTALVTLVSFLVAVPVFGGAVAGVLYLVGWGVEGTWADPLVEEIPNTNGSYRSIVPADEVGSPEDRILSGLLVACGAVLASVICYALRPRKVEGGS